LLAGSSALKAQFETATVLGYVRDNSGAVVPGASVTLTDEQTKTSVTAQTNALGSYEFPDVKIGQYQVIAKAAGFDTSATESFTVTVNARQRVDIAMKVGSTSETVNVTDAATLLQTDSSEDGQVIGAREVQNLPLNGREYADLAALVPGVRRNVLENSSGTPASMSTASAANSTTLCSTDLTTTPTAPRTRASPIRRSRPPRTPSTSSR
jgi:hypothetical protein